MKEVLCKTSRDKKDARIAAYEAQVNQSAKICWRNVQKYFRDILTRMIDTAKEELVNCVSHKWVNQSRFP